jgi:hypothetical protein
MIGEIFHKFLARMIHLLAVSEADVFQFEMEKTKRNTNLGKI